MRLCNFVFFDACGGHRVLANGVNKFRGACSLRFEPAFFLDPTDITISWARAPSEFESPIKCVISKETIIHCVPFPNNSKAFQELVCKITLSNYLEYHFRFSSVEDGESEIVNADHARNVLDQFHRDRYSIQSLSFAEMLMIASKRLKSNDRILVMVTGSTGKTSTKEAIADMLAPSGSFRSTDSWNYPHEIATQISLNTDFGSIFVVESAICPEMEILGEILPPDILVLTNIGAAHLSAYGTLENIAWVKSSLAKSMKPSGLIIVNGDDHILVEAIESRLANIKLPPRLLKVCSADSATADIYYTHRESGCATQLVNIFSHKPCLRSEINEVQVHLSHVPLNIALAMSATNAALMMTGQSKNTYEPIQQIPFRLEVIEHLGVRILNDAYNANIMSMIRFIDYILKIKKPTQSVVIILGEMLELGEHAVALHQEIINKISENFDPSMRILTIGDVYKNLSYGIIEPKQYSEVDDQLYSDLGSYELTGILAIKGSYRTGVLGIANYLVSKLQQLGG
ncbi:UDP-N-acetylmuramyl pentapeptide synthase [Pseudomonas jessenii]|uniref:UDP-N-acetylmuramyl pentapeptide synthase n=2 Tax=Pseudomonas jessenii TaxID=77298 RepID=A0A370S955_PSEJE|nr:UDP-N-acetylmuramyl pentapeptide synthase [Pseudomonas jessenii]